MKVTQTNRVRIVLKFFKTVVSYESSIAIPGPQPIRKFIKIMPCIESIVSEARYFVHVPSVIKAQEKAIQEYGTNGFSLFLQHIGILYN